MAKNAKLKIDRRDYGVIVALGSFREGDDPWWGVYSEERYLLVNHLETTDAVREISSFYIWHPSKQPLDGGHAYPST